MIEPLRHRNRVLTRLPIAAWLLAYRRAWWRADVVAGLTAAAVVLPKAMGDEYRGATSCLG